MINMNDFTFMYKNKQLWIRDSFFAYNNLNDTNQRNVFKSISKNLDH